VENPKPEAEADFVGKYTTPVGLSVSDDELLLTKSYLVFDNM